MKKFTKISLIVAAILLGIGILLETIASFLGAGFGELRRLAGNGEFDRGNWHIRENGIYYSGEESWHESEERDAEPSSACEEYEAATVKNMKIHVNAAHIYIQKSKNADKISVALEDGKEKYFKCGLKGDTLKIDYRVGKENHISLNGVHDIDEARLIISVPDETVFDTVKMDIGAAKIEVEEETFSCKNMALDVGAGSVETDALAVAENLSIELGAGEVILKNGKFKDVTVDCEMGNLEIDGTLAGDFNADCAMGNLTVNFAGNKADYNYELSCNMGNLEVNGGTYNGRDFYEKNEGAVGTISLDCNMGNVKLDVE